MAKQAFVLYSTEGCHLCEMAHELIAAVGKSDEVSLKDIVDDDLLVARYGISIPVIAHVESGAELNWPFDEHSLLAFFARVTQ